MWVRPKNSRVTPYETRGGFWASTRRSYVAKYFFRLSFSQPDSEFARGWCSYLKKLHGTSIDMRAGGRRHLPATESCLDFTAPFVGVCATVRGSSGWALATGNVPTERQNASRPCQGLARKWNSGAVTFVSSQSKTSGPWMMHMNWPCAEYDGRASSSSLSTSQLCTGAGGGALLSKPAQDVHRSRCI